MHQEQVSPRSQGVGFVPDPVRKAIQLPTSAEPQEAIQLPAEARAEAPNLGGD